MVKQYPVKINVAYGFRVTFLRDSLMRKEYFSQQKEYPSIQLKPSHALCQEYSFGWFPVSGGMLSSPDSNKIRCSSPTSAKIDTEHQGGLR
jgi:hypothetical protein